MYKICIADDERYVLKSITQRIESSGMELEVAGTARNGLEALELYDKIRPDIYFVDINMPVVNGLDLIDRIRRKDPETATYFIIISGYDDFAYMKKAILLGVTNYIKKPISQQEFTDIILDVCSQLKKKEMKGRKEERRSMSWSDFWQGRRGEKLEGSFVLIRKKEIGKEPEQFWEAMNRYYGEKNCTVIYFYGVQDVILLFFECVCLSGKDMDNLIQKAECRFASQVIYDSGKYAGLEELIGKFEDMLNLRFYHPEYRMMKLRNSSGERLDIDYEAFDVALDDTDEDHYTECIDKIWKPLLSDEKYHGMIKQVFQSLILLIANKYTKYDILIPGKLRQALFPFAVSGYEDRRELLQGLKEYADELNTLAGEVMSRSELVDNVIWYLEQHFREEISLSELAEHFFVVPAYLSRKFKEKKNCTVMQYLENIRLRKARELLESTSLSISDIARTAGYNDSNYFARSFKKVYGVSPRDYRNREERREIQ